MCSMATFVASAFRLTRGNSRAVKEERLVEDAITLIARQRRAEAL